MKHAVRSYFGTSSEDPDAWLAHYGRVARTNGWWTDVALLWNVGVAFEGAAEVWYGSVEAWSLQQGRTWDEFRQAFLRRFKPSHFSELLENSLRTIRQEGDEDIATYAGRFVSLHSRLPVGGPSLDALRYCWIRGLARDDWRDRLMMEVPMTFEEARGRSLRLEGAVAIMNATARLDPSTPTLETFRTSTASVSEGTRRPLGDAANVQELATALAHVLTTSAQDRRPPIRSEADGLEVLEERCMVNLREMTFERMTTKEGFEGREERLFVMCAMNEVISRNIVLGGQMAVHQSD